MLMMHLLLLSWNILSHILVLFLSFLETLCCCYVLHLYTMYWVIKHFLTLYCITKYDILA